METTRLAEKPSLNLRRHYPVAPEKVWRAWTDPEALKRWWGPGGNEPVSLAQLDVRVGGRFRIIFGGPQGTERRKDPRVDLTVPATLTLVGLTVDGRLVNVSARGVCFVTTNPHLRVAESNFVRIDFALPADLAAGGAPSAVRRYVRITRVEPAEVDGSPGRRLGLAWDEPVLLAALA